MAPAGRAAALDPLDEGAQELFLRVLVAAREEAEHLADRASRCSAEIQPVSAAFRDRGDSTVLVGPIGARSGAWPGAEDLPLPEVPAGWRGRGRRDPDADDGQRQAGDVLARGEVNLPGHPLP